MNGKDGWRFIGYDRYDHFISIVYCFTAFILSLIFLLFLRKAITVYFNLRRGFINVSNLIDAKTHSQASSSSTSSNKSSSSLSVLNYYLDIRVPCNLEYWLSVRDEAKRNGDEDLDLIIIVLCTLIFDTALVAAAFVRVTIYQRQVDLFNLLCVFDIIILSLYLISFLFLLADINSILTGKHLRLLQIILHSMNIEQIQLNHDKLTIPNTNTAKYTNTTNTLVSTTSSAPADYSSLMHSMGELNRLSSVSEFDLKNKLLISAIG